MNFLGRSLSRLVTTLPQVLTLFIAVVGGLSGGMPTGPLRLLRLLRLSRLVRLLREMPELLTLINGMKVAARAVSSALLLIVLLNYVPLGGGVRRVFSDFQWFSADFEAVWRRNRLTTLQKWLLFHAS